MDRYGDGCVLYRRRGSYFGQTSYTERGVYPFPTGRFVEDERIFGTIEFGSDCQGKTLDGAFGMQHHIPTVSYGANYYF